MAAGRGGSPSGREGHANAKRPLMRVSDGRLDRVSDFDELRQRILAFTDERDWAQFHDPKSLLLALVGEVGELAELFQWLPPEEADHLAATGVLRSRVGEEIADVLTYVILLADRLDIDLVHVTDAKLRASALRFPPGEHHGSAPQKH